MGNISSWFRSLAVLLCLAACAARQPDHAVVIHYQHVANAHQIHFATPLALEPHEAAYVKPREAGGFWAIFVLCSLDVTAKDRPSFIYDINNFTLEYNDRVFGPLAAYTLRVEDSYRLNDASETPVIADAIATELNAGPSFEVFTPGYYPSLNYRFALFVPKGLDDYAGEPLKLRYRGPPSLVLGNGYPPHDIQEVGGNGTGVSASCVP